MKKSLKLLIVAIVVLSAMVFCLSACGGGNNGPVDYGFTLEGKTITFDGNTYSLTVGANTTALNGKTYNATYSYTKDGVEVSKDGVRDAGVYEVIANVLVQGEETPKQLKATLTINKMDVSVEIGDQIIRQGSTIASLPDPVIPSNVKLGVGDSISDAQFEVEYEIKKGSDVITSLSSASATTKEEDALTISYKFKTAPNNYNFTFKTGKGYVLSTTDYVNATVIKGLIDNLPSQSKLNTLTYENMKLFIADAKKLIAEYPNLSFVQQKIVGSCDMTSVNALLKTAEGRLKAVYELSSDVDSSIGKVIFTAAQHINNDGRAQKDDDFISEFLGTKKSSRTNVEYKDVIAFEIWIKDTTKFALDSFFIGEKEYALSVVSQTVTADQNDEVKAYGDNAAKYVVGIPNSVALSGSYYGDENKGIASGGVAISSAVLGALDGDNTIEVKLNVNNKYTIEVSDERGNEIQDADDMEDLFIKDISVMARFVDYYLVNTNKLTVVPITDGTTAKLTLVPLEGYVLKEVAIGDVIVPGSAFEKNVYEFVISEDYADDKNVISIVPTFVEKLTLSDVRINNSSKKLENLYRDGVYTDNGGAGSIVIGGGDLSYADPIFDGDAEMTITLRPATNYLVSALKITGYDANGAAKVINVDLEDIENNRYTLELEGKFNATKTAAMGGIKIEAEYKKSFNFSVSGARNEEGLVNFNFNGDSFVSKYGELTIYKLEGTYPTEIKNFIEGDKILIAIDPEDGYVPKTIKINGKSVSRVDFVETDKYQMIRGKMAYVVDTRASEVVLGARFDVNDIKNAANYYEVNTATLAAGSNINIEVDFDAYYEIETDVYVSNNGTYTMSYKGIITDNGTTVSYAEAADGNPNNSGVINVKDKNFSYIYYAEKSPNRIYFTVSINDTDMYKFTEVSGKIGKAELSDANITSDKSYKATIDEAIGGTPETVAPGSAITITFEVEPVKIG